MRVTISGYWKDIEAAFGPIANQYKMDFNFKGDCEVRICNSVCSIDLVVLHREPSIGISLSNLSVDPIISYGMLPLAIYSGLKGKLPRFDKSMTVDANNRRLLPLQAKFLDTHFKDLLQGDFSRLLIGNQYQLWKERTGW
ncbi:MAG: hypothetical protein R3C11_09860 [Planctomycetaceae bacterium]